MAERRLRRGPIVFMAIWLVVWTAAILIVLFMLGGGLASGDYGAAPFLVLWLGFAIFGLYVGIRRMQTLLRLGPPPERVGAEDAPKNWDDGMPRRADKRAQDDG
jgi:hypothetical protein